MRLGTNAYYYLAGKHGIHPTYVQEMLLDSRYDVEDIVTVINHLSFDDAKSFSRKSLNEARQLSCSKLVGTWRPSDVMTGNDVLLLGTGPGVAAHQFAIEAYINQKRPIVIALILNLQLRNP